MVASIPSDRLTNDTPTAAELRAEIAQSLLLAEFEPATFFGQPVLGRVVITFTTVNGVERTPSAANALKAPASSSGDTSSVPSTSDATGGSARSGMR